MAPHLDLGEMWGIVPVSNSKPFSVKVWQHPPSFPCCSSTSTRQPALASSAAAARPPMPLPTTMASSFWGTFSAENTEGKAGRHREGTPQHGGPPKPR